MDAFDSGIHTYCTGIEFNALVGDRIGSVNAVDIFTFIVCCFRQSTYIFSAIVIGMVSVTLIESFDFLCLNVMLALCEV